MSLHTLFVRPEDQRPTVDVRPIRDFEPKVVLSIYTVDGEVSIHLPDMDYTEQLHQRIGNAIQAYVDEMNDTEVSIDLASDPQPDGGTVGIQPGNPTMDAHGPDPSVSYHSQAMDAARASIAHGPQTEAPSAYVAELTKASAAAEERRRRQGS